MSISVYKTFVPLEILTAADLNSSFLQITNNGEDVPFPRTKAAAMAGQTLTLDADGNTSLRASTDDQVDVAIGGVDRFRITATGVFFNGVLIGSTVQVSSLIDARTMGILTRLNELEDLGSIDAQFFNPGGM